MMAPTATALKVGTRRVPLSNLDKPLYPNGFTKGQIVDYYGRMASYILPHLKGRALTLKRYPNGTAAPFFYEKNCPSHRPPWVKTSPGSSRDETGPNYCLIGEAASLVWVANLASIELHVNLSKAASPDRPTSMVFDLDPGPPAGMRDCCELALKLKEMLVNQGLESFVKTSGGKGLHLYVPLNAPRLDFDQTKSFSHQLALSLEKSDPKVTASMSKATRAGKVFVDWSQNDRHKTTCCVYSLRARATPTVSTPLDWSEVVAARKKKTEEALSFTSEQVLERVAIKGDLFAPILKLRQRLPSSL